LSKPLADIELVKRVVVEAGKHALSSWGNVAFEHKADTTLVTAIDRETERAVEDALGREYPEFAFLGEEYGRRGPEGAPIWACDPIDGTTNFVHGLGYWCVSVGLIHEGVSQLGAIYLPALDELFWGVRGQGAWCNGERLSARDSDEVGSEETVIMTSSAAKTLNCEAIPARLRCLGSIASELAQASKGSARAVVGIYEGIVDMAAGLCIGAEAGCEARYLDGPPVEIAPLLVSGKTQRPFAFGPPRVVAMLQRTLRER
jgi:myo-inositol-1(or 4)-monophosphatase